MNIVRTILALLMAISVALLPVAGAAVVAKASNISVSMDMSASGDMFASDAMSASMGMADCCPQTAPCDKASADCASMLSCGGIVFNMSAIGFSDWVFPMTSAEIMPVLTSQALSAQTSAPPFRPPRI